MSEIVADCPRCGAQKTTFDVFAANEVEPGHSGWARKFEAFGVCRHCQRATLLAIQASKIDSQNFHINPGIGRYTGSLNPYYNNIGYVSLKDNAGIDPPEHLPKDVESAFREGTACLAIKCTNAAGTMFRLCVDFATHELLPAKEDADGPNPKVRRDLGLRLQWLFNNGKLPTELHDLALCIKEDGNDGAHRGTLTEADAYDLLDFTVQLLERRYTLPKRLEAAAARRATRPRNI